MAGATIERDGDAVVYTMPRNAGTIVASLAVILFCFGLAALVLRSDGAESSIWVWLFPTIVALGLLPTIVNAATPRRVRVDATEIEIVRWYGRRRIAWSEAVEAVSYTNGQDLFLRVRTDAARILLSTRWSGWDTETLLAIARRIDAILDEHPNVRRAAPLERFPSWFSKESGLGGPK